MLIEAIARKHWQRSFAMRGTLAYHLLHVGFQLCLFTGISRAVGSFGEPGATYAGFVLPALGAGEIMSGALLAPRRFLETESELGTLEQLATSTPSLFRLMALESLAPLCAGLLELAVYVGAGWWLAGGFPRLGGSGAALALAVALLFAQFWFLGIVSAGAMLWVRRGASINSAILAGATLLGGIYFPLGRLPAWAQAAARASALPAVNDLLRGQGSWSALTLPALVLVFTAATFPAYFELCLRRARRSGNLMRS